MLIPIVEQFQSSVWINPGLPWFHLTLLCDGWRKLAPCSQAIRFETKNHCNLVISVLSLPWPVLAFDTCIKSATCRTRVWYQSFNGVHVAYYWVSSVGKNVPVGFKSFYFRHSRQKTWLFVSWFKWLEGYWTLCMVKHRQTTRWARRETGQSSRTVPKKVLKKWNDHRIFAWKTGIQWN